LDLTIRDQVGELEGEPRAWHYSRPKIDDEAE